MPRDADTCADWSAAVLKRCCLLLPVTCPVLVRCWRLKPMLWWIQCSRNPPELCSILQISVRPPCAQDWGLGVILGFEARQDDN